MTIDRRTFTLTALALAGAGTEAFAKDGLAVDEGGFVDINGVAQWIGLRGYDANNPVMLFLHGGPGLGITHGSPALEAWERTFTIAYWDMPHGGATHARNLDRDEGPLTEERFVRDAITVAEHVRRTTGRRKIVLFGISFGTRIGAELIHRRPDLFSAYVGTAQAVSGPRGTRMGYDMALERAKARGDQAAMGALQACGPPPYISFQHFLTRQAFTNPPGLPPSAAEAAAVAAAQKLLADHPIKPSHSVPQGLPAFDVGANFMRVQEAMYQQASHWDAAALGRDFKVPVFVFQGSDDLNTPLPLAREWVAQIRAPKKAFAVIEGSSHNTMPFHAELLDLMRKHVLPVVTA